MTLDELTARRQRLQQLLVTVDQELASVDAALRIYLPRPGYVRKPMTMPLDEARAWRTAYKRGDRSPQAIEGRREYDRHMARLRREAAGAA